MHITQWGEYGIHCAVYIAHRHVQGVHTVGAAEIAQAQGIALQYAQQILLRLRRGGVIDSVRGPQGGYRLAKAAKEISLYDILLATEGDTFEIICDNKPINLERCCSGNHCELRTLWRDLREHVDSFFSRYNLAELAERFYKVQDLPVQIGGENKSVAV